MRRKDFITEFEAGRRSVEAIEVVGRMERMSEVLTKVLRSFFTRAPRKIMGRAVDLSQSNFSLAPTEA